MADSQKTDETITFTDSDETLHKYIDSVVNTTQKKLNGDELLSLYNINKGKKHKDSLTYRSRMNRNQNIKFLKEELAQQEARQNWWERDDTYDFKYK